MSCTISENMSPSTKPLVLARRQLTEITQSHWQLSQILGPVGLREITFLKTKSASHQHSVLLNFCSKPRDYFIAIF